MHFEFEAETEYVLQERGIPILKLNGQCQRDSYNLDKTYSRTTISSSMTKLQISRYLEGLLVDDRREQNMTWSEFYLRLSFI